MKIPIIYIPKTKFKKFLYIEKSYTFDGHIIPIGCDCHPAYSLNYLKLRKTSLPFDWLNIDPLKTIGYVTENICNEFADFLKDIRRNENGFYISEKHPYAEFVHENELGSVETMNKFKRRIERFLNLIKNPNIVFLHTLPVNLIHDETSVVKYIESIRKFLSIVPNATPAWGASFTLYFFLCIIMD